VEKTINKTYVIPDKLDIRYPLKSNIVVKAAEGHLKRNEK
jgi:hypothetical protein